ncbi:aminotransferase [Mangrovicella endophytica]|uniref:aminotransferase n=1 Tax=Mangrovicella endophytica TaxID=2066697 RepID=UPI000C9DF9B3|nr:aminotransferase [Mangrovicella endophytica]
MVQVRINPFLARTSAPPIPESRAWADSYDGLRGSLLNLAQAVPGDPPPQALLDRIGAEAGRAETTTYGPIEGDAVLRTALAADICAVYGSDVTMADVAITAGCNQAFFVAMMALAAPGDAVMLPTPWYFNHKMTLDMLGIQACALPCRAEAGFVPDVEDARRLIGSQTRAIVLVTPNNPTGATYPDATIHAFHDLCRETGLTLVLDETYRDFLPEGMAKPHSLLREPSWRDRVLHLHSFSKSYAVPGHRLGALVAAPTFIEEVAKVMDCQQICPPRAAQGAIAWAIDGIADWRAATRRRINERAAVFRQAIAAIPGWQVSAIGAYFAYVRPPSDEPMRSLAARLARERGVLVLPGDYFTPSDAPDGHLRFAFANVGAERIAELPARLQGFA